MLKKLTLLLSFALLHQIIKAQSEFITLWQPGHTLSPSINVDAPFQANSNQIWFPGIGENFTITWEEVGYPSHNGTMADVTSVKQVLIDFGTSLNPGGPAVAKYVVKVKNGSGLFKQIRFGEAQLIPLTELVYPIWTSFGSSDKILEIQQWGNTEWVSMNGAFANCRYMNLTATDVPNLSNVTDAKFMLSNTPSFAGAPSMQYWDMSNITDFSFMFSRLNDSTTVTDVFNSPYLSGWDISSAQNLRYMFVSRAVFNQNLNSWGTSNVTDMSYMFGHCPSYNQPLDKWDTFNVTNMDGMFHFDALFNQRIDSWDTSKVTTMAHMFHGALAFNQPIQSWNMGNITNLGLFLSGASNFNQPLGNWNLSSLTDGHGMITSTSMDCINYTKSIVGWADNPNTVNNIVLGPVSPAQYAPNAVIKRNILISKNWSISGDSVGSCFLSTSENILKKNNSIYPNPAVDDLHIDFIKDTADYKILDMAGRIVLSGTLNRDIIDISSLVKGNYILQVTEKGKSESFKFIKK